jgi:RNA polymerase sigma factor (sigma-70 family)
MFHYGIKFINDPEFIKDCIQDVFINLINAGMNLGTTDNIRFYLFKALKNNILKNLDRYRKEETFEILPFRFEQDFSVEDELIERESHSEKAKLLILAMESLSDRQRESIYLRYQCGLKYDEISELMQISNDSARKLVYRAIHFLREKIGSLNSSIILFCFSRIDKYVL